MSKVVVGRENGDRIRLHYTDRGAGRPVVLIHGWPLSGRAWEAQEFALIEAGYRVITYDRRGFGQSSKPWHGYDYDTFAADLDALLQHLDLHDATLVGFSMGGGEVVRYLARYGADRIRSVVLAGAVPPFLLKTDDNPDGAIDQAFVDDFQRQIRADRMAFLDGFLTFFYSVDGELKISEPQRQHALRIAASASAKATHDCVTAWGTTDFRADVAAVNELGIPVLVVHGDSDAIVPFEVSGARTGELLAHSTVRVIAGAPHGFGTSHAAEVNAALLAFLAD